MGVHGHLTRDGEPAQWALWWAWAYLRRGGMPSFAEIAKDLEATDTVILKEMTYNPFRAGHDPEKARAEVKRRAAAALKAIDAADRAAKINGKRRARKLEQNHYRQTALYQCGGVPVSRLAVAGHVADARSAPSKAINAILAALSLDRRPDRRGRPVPNREK